MPRYRNTLTGVVVSVDDATAAQLGRDFESLEAEPTKEPEPVTEESKPKPRGRTVRKP